MPTPVNIARQCLAPAAVQALDEAVAVAHRRCHAQTSSLHAISALLSLPSSPLREACGRTRHSAYASRIHFKALELCLGVALDRLPTTPQRVEEPPVSNSLMAAIKRSQANQRRQPESFHLYQQSGSCSPSSASVSMVKVELQNLILSILDDPVVSRVFVDSGFRSSDIKLSILRPIQRRLLRCKGQPIFLCNLNNNFSFPFHGYLENNEICKKIKEILVRKDGESGNNPLLVGTSAIDAVKIFLATLHNNKIGEFPFSPPELSNLTVISIKDEILNVVNGNSGVSSLKLKLEEVGSVLKQSTGPGVMIEYGDLKVLTSEDSSDGISFLVEKLDGLLTDHPGRIWLIGAAESHEICLQFFKNFPSVEEKWNLQVITINSIRPMAETFPKSSLMESFVPFGGFFSMPSDIKNPLRISNHHFRSLCRICDEKFKLEANDVYSGHNGSVSDHHRSTLPSWLQTSQLRTTGETNHVSDHNPVVVTAKVAGLQKKWQSICHRLHQDEQHMQMFPKATFTVDPRVPSIVGFQIVENTSSIESGCDTISKSNPKNIKHSPAVYSLSGSSERDDTSSPVSANSVTTDLGLAVNRSPVSRHRFDLNDSKVVHSSLFTRVGRQEEALGVVSEAIVRCRTRPGSNRGGIWFGFVGSDEVAKKKTAVALAEVLLGGQEHIICVDLSCQYFMEGGDIKLRGKNVVDFIADEISKKQLCIVFLENVDMADPLTQHHLSSSASSGRFSDSHGREVSISNAIFVLTSKLIGGDQIDGGDYTEENVLNTKCVPIRMLTGFDLDDMKPSPKVVTRNQQTGSPVCKNKRKLDRLTATNLHLDLNLPAEESDTGYSFPLENSSMWLEELLEHMDEKVVFQPFDFIGVSEKILKLIGDCFERIVGFDSSLEIDYKVMEQFLKASCFLGTVKLEDWIEEVLAGAFAEAQRKYGLVSHSVVKLIAGELPEEQPGGVLLPDTIVMT